LLYTKLFTFFFMTGFRKSGREAPGLVQLIQFMLFLVSTAHDPELDKVGIKNGLMDGYYT